MGGFILCLRKRWGEDGSEIIWMSKERIKLCLKL